MIQRLPRSRCGPLRGICDARARLLSARVARAAETARGENCPYEDCREPIFPRSEIGLVGFLSLAKCVSN
jgi:hypothetical protein